MPDENGGDADGQASGRDEILKRIADTLGCSVEALLNDGEAVAGLSEISQILTLWVDISAEGRGQILDLARKLVKA